MKKSICVSIYLILLMIFVNNQVSYASKHSDLFDEILVNTKSKVEEYGLKISIKAENSDGSYYKNILSNLGIDNKSYYMKEIKNEKSYYIEFKSSEISGYLEYMYESDDETINIELIKSGHKLELNELEHRLKKAINSNNSIKLYRYIKARTEIADTNETKEALIDTLKNNRAGNIDSIDLGDSISITAQTGEYEKIKNGDTWIDFNSAICSYKSGNYLIIGTPIIMKSY